MMELLLADQSICNVPNDNSYVYKDECVYCFDTLESDEGLFICMKTFIGVCKNHLDLFHRKTLNKLFLNLRIEKRSKLIQSEPVGDEGEYKKLLKEAYATNKFDLKEFKRLYVMPQRTEILLPKELPNHIQNSIDRILSADCIAKASELAQKSEKWDYNFCPESKHARLLIQLNNNVRIPPHGWKCSRCDLTTNLWLNLTDGVILCGRKFFDGSGGNNHAIDHYTDTKYPLAVKLGTITPQRADVFSYDEDSMVIDPLLAEHLAHFGIDIMKMHKTDKSVEEIEMENIKRNREQIAIMGIENQLEQLHGPGFTGIINTGNSCYINSVMQVIFTIPEFKKFYSDRYLDFINDHDSHVTDDVADFRIQLAKIGYYLSTGVYSYPIKPCAEHEGELIEPFPGITPQMFRIVIGQNHVDFSTKQQQDAYEYLIHVMTLIRKDAIKHRHKDRDIRNPLESVLFKIEDRVFCETSQTVKYQYREESILSLPIPIEEAVPIDLVANFEGRKMASNNDDDVVKPTVNLESCLQKFIRDDIIVDYMFNGQTSVAYHSSKLETFPEYLWIQLKRFAVGSDWMPKKLDVNVIVPDTLDLSSMKAYGLQPHEVPMPDEPVVSEKPVELNMPFVQQLLTMGFSENACKKAVLYTKNASLDDAANWLMMHIEDEDFNELPVELATNLIGNRDAPMPSESDIEVMMNMGFSRKQAVRALQETNSLERAADWAFNHIQDLEAEESATASNVNQADATVCSNKEESVRYSNGEPKYSLVALVSHMGNNAHVGHYVCHIRQPDGSWALFNDEKVQKTMNPPKQFAYLYLYQRNC